MKNFSVDMPLPYVFVKKNGVNMLVPSMVLSTITACVLITFVPQLMPLWMSVTAGSWL